MSIWTPKTVELRENGVLVQKTIQRTEFGPIELLFPLPVVKDSLTAQDPYASEAETNELLKPDTRSQSEKYLDGLLDVNGANEQGADAYSILYKIALELVGGKHADVIGVYNGREGRRDWWSGGCWLRPNEAVAVITVEGEQ